MHLRKLVPALPLLILLALFVGVFPANSADVALTGVNANPPSSGGDISPDTAVTYVFTDLGVLPHHDQSEAMAINQLGHITGYSRYSLSTSAILAFSYFNGTMTSLGSLQANGTSVGLAINDSGVVVGNSSFGNATISSSANIAAKFANGQVTALGDTTPWPYNSGSGTVPRLVVSNALGIDNSGVIVGTQIQPSLNNGVVAVSFNPAVIFSGGKIIDVHELGGTNGIATAINSFGQIVGTNAPVSPGLSHAMLVPANNNSALDLGALSSGTYSIALALNDAGDVVGFSSTNGLSGNHAFLYSNGQMTDLGTLGGASQADGINNSGDIVGTAAGEGFIYTNGVMTSLNSLGISVPSGTVFVSANGINDAGQIVGMAIVPPTLHAYLLTPSDKATPPALGSPLVNAIKVKGDSLLLDPGLSGGNPLTIQWYKNKVALAGQTGLTLNLTNLQTTQTGNYSVTATNLVGQVSANMTLTVDLPTSVTKPPVSLGVLAGKPVKFSVTATGTAPVSYLWQVSTDGGSTWANVTNSNGITGAMLASLAIANATLDLNGNQYQCIISNPGSTVTTTPVTLAVGTPPKITSPPANTSAIVGQDITFSATVTGSPAPAYQWYKGKTALGGETNSTLTLTNVQTASANTYSVTATNLLGSATAKATLKIVTPASITKQPVNVSVAPGKSAKFTLTAAGTTKLTYQWEVSTDGGSTWTPIAKATTNTYSIAKTTTLMNNQQFHCLVNNPANQVTTSNPVTLFVGS